ncbi:hypothetical protein COL23_25645 [Priestia aryabhattai]|uniref:hypothetical protein n=1 Tax=Priestia aryabhattai TaxID=412384 RepID=UPI000BF9B32D|nr:hypothetical protein [Priestia aryabhattai]PFW72137.1 hypothetical protein COL23_25645 [Priestia aryabhattai]
MNNKLDRQLEKELEQFIRQNWKSLVPLASVGGGIWWCQAHDKQLQHVLETTLPYVQTGAIIGGSIGAVILTLSLVRWHIVRKKEKENYRYFRLLPRTEQDVNGQEVHQLIRQLSHTKRGWKNRLLKGREWLQFLIHRDKEGIAFYIGCPKDQQKEVKQAFQNAYPESELHAAVVSFPSKGSFTGRMRVKNHRIKQWMPFTSYQKGDQIANLLSYMPPDSWISVEFTAESKKKIGKKLFRAEKEMKKDKKMSEMYSFQKEQFKDITGRLHGDNQVFKTSISLAGEGSHRKDIVKSLGRNIAGILNGKNNLLFKRSRQSIQFCPHPRKHLLYLTNNELANLVHLPTMKHQISEHVPKLEKGQQHLDENTLNKGLTVGYNLHPLVKERPVKISFEQLTEHWINSGMTGSGKSSLLIQALQSLIDEWLEKPNQLPGFTFLDPAGTTVRTLLNRLMKAEVEGKTVPWNKVIFLSYKNGDHPIGLNFLHKNPWEDTDTVVNNAMSLFKSVFPGDKTRIDKYLSNTLTALIDDVDHHSVLGVNRFLTDVPFRNTIVKRIQDPILKEFWEKADPKEIKQISSDIYSRVNTFEQSLFMRRMFGQTNWDLPLKKFMDEGYIVLMDIQGFSKQNIQYICGHLVNQYHQVCQKRKPYSSKEHFLIVDEAHLIQIQTMEKIIAEDRKFGLCLGLSTQYLGQFQEWLQKAIDGNVQNIITGSQGYNESLIMANLMKKQFEPELIASLPNNHAAILTKNADKTLTTCLVKSELPYMYKPDGSVAKYKDDNDTNIVEAWIDEKAVELQAAIGRSPQEIDEKINEYYGFNGEETEEEFYEDESNQPTSTTGGNEEVETVVIESTEIPDSPMEEASLIEEESVIMEEEKNKKETEKEDSKEVDAFF